MGKKNKINFVLAIILMLIGACNFYYFFLHRGVGLKHYINTVSGKSEDHIVESSVYKYYSEAYKYLNRFYSEDVVVFLGDSITARFPIAEFFPDELILNRGIFSDTTVGLLNRLEENCNNLNVKKTFILIGYNDLKYRENNEIINNIKNIVKKVRAENIYLISILPVGVRLNKYSQRIRSINAAIERISLNSEGLFYINIYSHFVNIHGNMKGDYSGDGVHPNIKGYLQMLKILRPYILD